MVSRTAGTEHTILAHKKHGEWKIISDTYNDDLWRMLRNAGKSTDEILRTADEMIRTLEASPRPSANRTDTAETVSASVLAVDLSSHNYNRDAAVQYALDHWGGPLGTDPYNPDYFNYPGTDCQNFVSQALYEGGDATMFIPDPQNTLTQGHAGWFYLNHQQYASGWTDVETFFVRTTKFGAVDPETWRENFNQGPEGTLLSERLGTDPYQVPTGLIKGDVIQFEWVGTLERPDNNGPLYDHTGIVVDVIGGEPYIAAHTENHESEPLTNFMPWEKIRFIHIERSNGYPPVKAEIIGNPFTGQSGDDAGTIHGPCAFSYTDNEVYFGACPNSSSITSGFNFKSIQIPQGAQIKYAYLTFTIDGEYTAPIGVQIYGDEVGNSPNFNAGSPPASRPTPSALSPVAQWNISDQWILTWPLHERRTTPQLAPIIQNIVGRGDWVSGNALSMLIRNNGPTSGNPWPVRRVFAWERAFEDTNASAAKLIVAYEPASAPPALSQTFPSVAAQDGWILESGENSEIGSSTLNAGANTFTLGDNGVDKQYRSILHFNTGTGIGALPQNAVITSATLRIKQQSITGTNPFTTHVPLSVDIRMPYFGTSASLVAGDFQAAAGQPGVATFNSTPISGWYTATLTSGLSHINLNGSTQFRLAFTLGDNDDMSVDTILFSSGNHGTAANRPQLVVEYYEDQGLVGSTP